MSDLESDLVVLFENEDWQRPLFEVLDMRGVPYEKFDLKAAVFDGAAVPRGKLYFNQASPECVCAESAAGGAVHFGVAQKSGDSWGAGDQWGGGVCV